MYNVRTGQVVDAYPVYSVHQDGMAPMALLKLVRMGDRNYVSAINKGLDWLNKRNALELDMVDEKWRTIWRAQGIPRLFKLQPRLMLNAAWARLVVQSAGMAQW